MVNATKKHIEIVITKKKYRLIATKKYTVIATNKHTDTVIATMIFRCYCYKELLQNV